MDDNRRRDQRYDVYLYVEQVERDLPKVRIMNMSSSGFLVRGEIAAGMGGVFHARFRVRPSSGEMRVSARGKVVHSRRLGFESEYGVNIEGFGSADEESAYQSYVRELAEKASTAIKAPS
jgi:hypothetical protein